jgi:hypothetical protein
VAGKEKEVGGIGKHQGREPAPVLNVAPCDSGLDWERQFKVESRVASKDLSVH